MECFFISVVPAGSMKVRLARAAEDSKKVSADDVRCERTGKKRKISKLYIVIASSLVISLSSNMNYISNGCYIALTWPFIPFVCLSSHA